MSTWSNSSDAAAAFMYIFSNLQALTPFTGFGLRVTSGKAQWLICSNTGLVKGVDFEEVKSTSNVTTGSLIHLCGTYDGAILKLYINGILDASISYTVGLVHGTGQEVEIASNTTSVRERYFNGVIDELKVFTRAISAAEVSAMYTADGGT